MKKTLIILVMLPLFLTGCLNDLFDKGDVEKTYDGPTVVAFFPLLREVTLAAGSTFVQVQLIGEQRSSDLSVNFTVAGASTAVAGTHYTIGSSPVTIAAGTSTVNIPITLIGGSLAAGQTVLLQLELQGAGDGVAASENLKTARVFIRG
jgi:hypothetical protein